MSESEAVVLDGNFDKNAKYQPAPRTGSVRCINSKSFHTIQYQDWGDLKSKETVFCIHGLTRNSHDFDVIANQMGKKRRVVCADTAGRGRSDWLPDHEDYQIPQYNTDFNTLTAHIGCEEYSIIGTSLGGMMGMILAAMPNSPVKRLVVNDIAPEVPHTAMARLGGYLHLDPWFRKIEDVEKHLRKTLAPFNPMTDEDWAHMAQASSYASDDGFRLAFDPDISNTYGRRYWYLMYFNLWKYWVRIKCPVLILRGTESDFLTQSLCERMMRKLPQAELLEFENTGHTPTLNSPEQIDPVIKWLDKN